jgi:adenylate cyclase class IV
MAIKESNEITVKIKCDLEEIYKTLEKKGFKINHKFSMDDTFFIPETLELEKMTTREILSKAVLVRDIIEKTSGKLTKKITVKIKNFDENGNILNQKSINCDITSTEDAKNLLKAMGYKEIMNIKENDIVYEKYGLELAIKDIENGDNLIEIETTDKYNTIEKLIQKIKEIQIPIYTDDFFVKKAEIELNKILKNKK